MKSKAFERTARTIGVLVLAVSISALAQDSTDKKFRGVINAYSPQTTTTTATGTATTTGPYEVRGPWSLKLKGDSGKADFSAELTMELSDGWVLTENNKNFDPSARGAHTHHITLVDGDVTPITNPNGFRVTGTATIMLNGTFAPISPAPLVIDITGGNDLEFSNITLTFQLPASKHFGVAPLPGVVRSVKEQGR
jgi:hypothetical protein